MNWDMVGALAESAGAVGAIVALGAIFVQIRAERLAAQQQSLKDTTLELSNEMRRLWHDEWHETIRVLRSAERPMIARDDCTVEHMLNWLNWIGTMHRSGVVSDQSPLLDPDALGPAMGTLLKLGRARIKADVWRFGPRHWQDLRPIAERLNKQDGKFEWLLSLLDDNHQHFLGSASHHKPFASGQRPEAGIDSLKGRFPHEPNQLHAGGWRATEWLIRRCGITDKHRVLDLCCGEGASAIWIARVTGAEVVGIDLDPSAIAAAQDEASRVGLSSKVTFRCQNLLDDDLADADSTFDYVIGQDPDALADEGSDHAFEQVRRVLQPGGLMFFHHWVPQPGAPSHVVDQLSDVHRRGGWPTWAGASGDRYIRQMSNAGLRNIAWTPLTEMYRETHEAIVQRLQREFLPACAWTEAWLDTTRAYPCGVAIGGRR